MSKRKEAEAPIIEFTRAPVVVRTTAGDFDALREKLESLGFVIFRSPGTRGERIVAVSPSGVVIWAYVEEKRAEEEASGE